MLYTRNGDCGKSSLIDRKDISKDDIIFDVLGTVDELSAFLGMSKLLCSGEFFAAVEVIQKELIEIGAAFSGGKEFDFSSSVKNFEGKIDALMSKCPNELVIYGTNEASARFDVARAVCRRAERIVVKYSLCRQCPKDAVAYFNRLSDYLYIIARCLEKGRK